MAGTAKGYSTTEIQQGPGDLWAIATAPDDATQRLTLASDGTPDSGSHTAVHLGLAAAATTFLGKTKMEHITADQADAPVDAYMPEMDARIETELEQLAAAKIQRMVGVGTYSTAGGYKQMTFGGTTLVPKICLAAISPQRNAPTKFVYSMLYNAVALGPFSIALGRAKPATYKAVFQGCADPTRTAGVQIGVVVNGLLAPTGILPTAKDYTVSEIQQGPADLWIVGTPPTNTAQRLTLDSATLTPDATAHPLSICLGLTETAVTLSLAPKIEMIKADQCDGPVDAYCTAFEAKLEATLSQAAFAKLTQVLGLGSGAYSEDSGGSPAWEQIGVGGLMPTSQFCVAAIAPKRSDVTKAWVACLYKVISDGGISVLVSRAKPWTYKVTFTGLADLARTAGRQTGVVYETI